MTDDRGPIFIGGLSYSGKTQLRMVLESHPDISMTRRTYMWERFYGRFGDLSDGGNMRRCLSAMLAEKGVQRLSPDPERIHREFLRGPATYARLFGLLHHHHAERSGKRRWGDQLGFVERFADPIFDSFPSARMIHMIREPCARYAAARKGTRTLSKLGWETALWVCSADLAERNRRRYPDTYRVVRYETFADRPSETVRELCTFLGEDYVASMEKTLAAVRFDPVISQDETRSAGDLRGNVTPADGAFVDMYARERLQNLGYAVWNARLAPRDQLAFYFVNWPLNRATMGAWRLFAKRPLKARVGS
jgi:Sulfotransferase family